MNRIIIDTREDFEYQQSHVQGAINIPASVFANGDIPTELTDAPKDTEIIVYCRSGQRSNTAAQYLKSHGFNNIVNGINEHHVAKRLKEENSNAS
jgi:rhodanese-related sulfurtransferase